MQIDTIRVMKTREVIFDTDVTLKLLDAYGNTRASIRAQANMPISVMVPLRREAYQDEQGKRYFIYDGEGILEDVDIDMEFVEISDELIDDFDMFLTTNQCKSRDKALFQSIYKILDLNTLKQDYIKCSLVEDIERGIIGRGKKKYKVSPPCI